MGLFSKKKKALDKLNQIEQNNFTPLDTFNLENNILAQEAAIDSQVGTTSILDSIQWNRWIHINLWADYYANRFRYETLFNVHNVAINRALRNGFIYGRVGVWNNNGTPEIVQYINEENGKLRVSVIKEDTQENNPRQNNILVDKNQVIYYQFNSLAYSAFLTLAPVLKLEQLIQKVLYNETLTNATRILRDTEAGSSAKAAQQFINFNSPIIHRLEGGSDRYQGLTLDTNTDKALEVMEYAKNWYYEVYGRRTNSDFKKTHSLNSEIEAGQFNCEVIERDRHMYLKIFLKDYANLFNIKIQLENLEGNFEDVSINKFTLRGEQNNDTNGIN